MNGARLPEGYYLANFETVLSELEARHGDLLLPEEHGVLLGFRRLSLAAQRLHVRMLTRKGPWFRRDGLRYAEIGDPAEPLEELLREGFCSEGIGFEEVVPLLKRADLLRALEVYGHPAPRGLDRSSLLDRLALAVAEGPLLAHLRSELAPVRLAHAEFWRRAFLMFFGGFDQDLSSFVATDVGNLRFEAYALDPGARVFGTRAEVDSLLALRGLRERFEARASRDELEALTRETLALEVHPGLRQQRRFHRLLNDQGQAWERERNLERAWTCYSLSERPPAGERRTRILAARGEWEAACRLATELAEAPRDVAEERFALAFLHRHRKQVPFAQAWVEAHGLPAAVPERRIALPLRPGLPVEMLALEAARAEGWEGFFAENLLWRGLFGLALWDAVFAAVPGVFQHRFQNAPLDLGSPDFHLQRRDLIEGRLDGLAALADPSIELLAMFDRKAGLANPFVNWRHLERGRVAAAASRIPGRVMVEVFRRMATNPLAFDSGFPDLFLHRPDSREWRLWEVKGPGDSLRPEQEDWLRRFLRLGVEAEVVRIG